MRVTADGLPPGKNVDLMWSTVTGGWVIEDSYYFRGKKYEPVANAAWDNFRSTASGRLDARFRIPEDYGGLHEVSAVIDGQTIAQKGIEVTQSFEMRPASGPVGTPIELTVKGLGFRVMESTWVVNWDNSLAGFVSAASSKGSAVARFRAAGPAGPHVVQVLSGFQGLGYLNHEQAPNDYLPRPAVLVPDDRRTSRVARAVRRTVSDAAGARRPNSRFRPHCGAGADPGSRRYAGDAQRAGLPGEESRCSCCGKPRWAAACRAKASARAKSRCRA